MEIRNNAEALKAFLGVSDVPGSAQTNRRADGGRAQVALSGDQVSLSEIGAKVLNSASQENVRLDKVSAVQEAIATGTYRVPAARVADTVIEAMLSSAITSEG